VPTGLLTNTGTKTASWTGVTNANTANGYTIKINTNEYTVASGTSYDLSGLAVGDYSISVKANGWNNATHIYNESAYCTAVTYAVSSSGTGTVPENILLWGFVEDAGEDENENYIFPDKNDIDYSAFTRIENFNGDATFAMIGSGFRCIVTPLQVKEVYEPNSPVYSTTNVIESWTQEGTITISGSVYYLLRSGPGNNTGDGGLTIKVITQTE